VITSDDTKISLDDTYFSPDDMEVYMEIDLSREGMEIVKKLSKELYQAIY
jgi:hypothetical protein